jgi:hypothetical protein
MMRWRRGRRSVRRPVSGDAGTAVTRDRCARRRGHIASLAVIAFLVSAVLARAQAWGPPARSGSVSVLYQTIDNTGHLLTDGSLLPDGKSRDAALYFEADYAFTDHLSVSAGLPLVFARYIGPGPTPGPQQPVDLCHCWHAGWQDVGVTARYSVTRRSLGVTPSLSIGMPSHRYPYRGEAVIGRGLREIRLGLAAGRRLDVVSPKLSVQGSYSYAFVQRVLDVPNNRSNATFEGAVLATRKLSVRGFLTWQRTHGGLRAGLGPPPASGYPWGEIVSLDLFTQHDRLLRDSSLHAGAGASYAFPRLDLFGSYVEYVSGTNTHAGRAFTLGVSWPFELHARR